MHWRFLESHEPFTFFLNFRPDAYCEAFTYDVCVWVPGGRLDVSQTVAHLFIGFVLQVGFSALAYRHPENSMLRGLQWAAVTLLALVKELYDGFIPRMIGPIPIGGSGFSALDIAFTVSGQALALATALALGHPARVPTTTPREPGSAADPRI
ncbi:MAG: hypothetical protein HY704_16070 [Gemmatimonadetes bacterium]|nr:hypothetical protein [Gemmatimonadota bacterium]